VLEEEYSLSSRDKSESLRPRRLPAPPMKSSVPPGRTLIAACRATCSRRNKWA